VLYDLLHGTLSVLFRILEQRAELPIAHALPDHGHFRSWKMPLRRSRRRMDSREVTSLMAGAAFDRVEALPVGSAPNLHGVRMAVVSLPRKIAGGMAVHAAWMP